MHVLRRERDHVLKQLLDFHRRPLIDDIVVFIFTSMKVRVGKDSSRQLIVKRWQWLNDGHHTSNVCHSVGMDRSGAFVFTLVCSSDIPLLHLAWFIHIK